MLMDQNSKILSLLSLKSMKNFVVSVAGIEENTVREFFVP